MRPGVIHLADRLYSQNEILFFMSSRREFLFTEDYSYMAKTSDSGASFEFVSFIDPFDLNRNVMPSTVRVSATGLVTCVRRKDNDSTGLKRTCRTTMARVGAVRAKSTAPGTRMESARAGQAHQRVPRLRVRCPPAQGYIPHLGQGECRQRCQLERRAPASRRLRWSGRVRRRGSGLPARLRSTRRRRRRSPLLGNR